MLDPKEDLIMKFTEYKYERIDFDKVCNFYEESTQKIKASTNLNEIVGLIDEINKQCAENNVEFELISKLIVEIEANKNYTKGSRVTKAFDRIINQGWLHFESIQKGLNHED